MAMALVASICSINSLRVLGEKGLSLWTQSHRRALYLSRNTKHSMLKMERRKLYLCQSCGTWPQDAGDFDKPCFLNYRAYFNPKSADKENEEAMKYRRVVYDHRDWMQHRSSTRHARHLLSIASSRVVLALGPPVFSLTAIAVIITSYNEAVLARLLPHWLPLLHVPELPFSLTAPALALLLVFRTNASYSRFDEARKAWGATVNRTRDIVRQALTWMQHPDDVQNMQSFLRHAAAYSYTLKDRIAQEEELEERLTGLLETKELEAVLLSTHRPNFVLQIMSELVHNSALKDVERATMDANLTQLHDNLGTCERIFKTPIPLSYTRLTSRFLVIWHIALPLALWDQCRWIVVPATFLSAISLFCIDEVGVLIEEPFPILALGGLCTTVKQNVEGLVAAHKHHHQNNPPPKDEVSRRQETRST